MCLCVCLCVLCRQGVCIYSVDGSTRQDACVLHVRFTPGWRSTLCCDALDTQVDYIISRATLMAPSVIACAAWNMLHTHTHTHRHGSRTHVHTQTHILTHTHTKFSHTHTYTHPGTYSPTCTHTQITYRVYFILIVI